MTCSYCCMKQDKILNSFKKIQKLEQLPELNQYVSFAVTGGEPLLPCVEGRLFALLTALKQQQKPIYLYTNGLNLTPPLAADIGKYVDGINIGLHKIDIDLMYKLIRIHKEILPIRVLVWEKLCPPYIEELCNEHGIALRKWKMDDCDIENEDRVLWED